MFWQNFWKIENEDYEENVEFVDLVKSFPDTYSNVYLDAEWSLDTAGNEVRLGQKMCCHH